jgi:hypothetical protein
LTDRPIPFKAPMVRALLSDCKTQTRRVIKPHPDELLEGQIPKQLRTQIGDCLWVRENWQGLSHGDYEVTKSSQCEVRYAATDPLADLSTTDRGYPYRPSIHMPRWASRLTLTVTDVRVQRLQDISAEDAIAEGLQWVAPTFGVPGIASTWNGDSRISYAALWNHINGAGAWEANPWVIAYSFSVHKYNIDQLEGIH